MAYTLVVPNVVASVKFTAVTAHHFATGAITGPPANMSKTTSGCCTWASTPVLLAEGSYTMVVVHGTAQDGSVRDCNLNVFREPSENALLSDILAAGLSLAPTFDAGLASYLTRTS